MKIDPTGLADGFDVGYERRTVIRKPLGTGLSDGSVEVALTL